jgi:hypothetical protein
MSTFFVTAVLLLWRAHLSESAWNTDYAHAIRYVRSLDKPLLILFDLSSSEGGGGDWDQSAVFQDEKLDRALADDYVRLFVDLQTHAGRVLAADFGVTEYPRLVVIDRSGAWQVYRRSGFHSVDELQSILSRYRRAKLVSSPGTGSLSSGPTMSSPATIAAPLCKT